MKLPPLILASASPRRMQLLTAMGLEFQVQPSQTPELHHTELTASELARVNAYRKALAVGRLFRECLILGADTLVYLNGQLLGKPLDRSEAQEMLQALQGHTHEVVTGVCLFHWQTGRCRVFAESTQVRFKNLTLKEIDAYLRSINPLDKAGAYAIQEGGEAIVAELQGSYSNVVGLPVERLERELASWVKEG